MRLTFETRRHVFIVAFEQPTEAEPEPINPKGDVYSVTERRKSFDYEDIRPVGFQTGREPR